MHEHDQLATPADACREYAANVGADHPDRAWILTDYDTWERNPFYHGPAVPHPEDVNDTAELELSLAHDLPDFNRMTQAEVDELLYPSDSVPGDGEIPF